MRDTFESFDLSGVATGAYGSHAGVGAAAAARTAAAIGRAPAAGARGIARLLRAGPGLAGSLSLFLPGLGQVARGEITLGLFFLSSTGFFAAIAWALIDTFDRITALFGLLGLPIGSLLWWFASSYVVVSVLHLSSVLAAAAPYSSRRRAHHPVVSGAASVIVPGWGQLLNGDRARAGLFLGGVWVTAALWILGSNRATGFLNGLVPIVPVWEATLRQPFVAWTAEVTLPILIWSLAIYDAAASAAFRRVARAS
jgi:hypothetical protein